MNFGIVVYANFDNGNLRAYRVNSEKGVSRKDCIEAVEELNSIVSSSYKENSGGYICGDDWSINIGKTSSIEFSIVED